MHVTATDAKNHFGALCQQAKQAPVVVEKAGQPDTVLVSWSDYQRLTQAKPASLRVRRKLFAEQHRAWLDAHNQHHEQHGLWSDELRVW